MTFHRWLDGWKFSARDRRSRRGQPQRRKAAGAKLSVLTLEDRTVPAFLPPVDYTVGSYPQSGVVAAYINDDSVLDLAVANYYDSTVSVLLGNGDGTFQDAVTSATGANPLSLAVGDFNDDGDMDLATANVSDVSVLLGNGDGTFGDPSSLGVYGYPTSVAVGDFTGDGVLDLGVTSNYYYYETYVNVLVGNTDALGIADGTFSAPSSTFFGYGNFASATSANIDGGFADELVMANTYYGYYYGTVAVLGFNGTGSLVQSNLLYTGMDANSVAVGDVNADGSLDLVTTDAYYGYYGSFSYDTVSVMLGNGVGGFGGAQTYSAGSFPSAVVLGDFTGDHNVDIATSNYYGSDVSVLHGDGNGVFSNPVHFTTGSYPWGIAAGNFDGDDWLDAATANLGDYTVSALINNTDWPPPPPPPPPTVSINDVAVSEGNSGTTDLTFTIYLSAPSSQDITVHYATAGVTATDGSDYTGASGDVTIPHGQTSYPVTIAVTGDRVGESTETFTVDLSAPVNADLGDGQGIGYINDDEPTLSIDDPTVTEGNTGSVNATFTVRLSFASDLDVTVHYATANDTATAGSDYTSKSGDVTIPHGQTSATFTVAVTGDRLAENTETFVVNLSAPVNAGIADSQGVGAIVDNEPRISIGNVTKKEGNGGTIQFIFTVTLSAAYDQAVTVNYATANGTATAGSDYTAKNGTLTFAPGVRSMTITIIVLPDKAKETDETFFVNLSGASSNALLFAPQGVGTIQDDDSHGRK